MGIGSAIRGSLDFLLARQHEASLNPNNINITPANTLQSLFRRPREMPLPLTPVSVLRSMIQFEDLQALLWAWMLVGLFVLVALWSNPSETSFKPFLTDFVFRERLRVLHDDAAMVTASSDNPAASKDSSHDGGLTASPRNGRYFGAPFSSTSPFALTFSSKVSLSVRTPPYTRKDLGLFSVVTISHSMPCYRNEVVQRSEASSSSVASQPKAKPDGTSDCTSVFIGAFGKWWVLGYGIPDSVDGHSGTKSHKGKEQRAELEENREEMPDWGVLEMLSTDPETDPRSVQAQNVYLDESENGHNARRSSDTDSNLVSRNVSPVPPATKEGNVEVEAEECLSLTALVARTQADVLDLQEQLAQIKAASTRACESLEADLEDIRSKKKEEEKSRSDTKSRTKALDDSKRQVEGNRREAERRLKAVNAARTLKENSIAQKQDQIEALKKRRANLIQKTKASSERRIAKTEELHSLSNTLKARIAEIEEEISTLRQKVGAAEETLAMEKTNLQAAQDLAHWREAHRIDPQPSWNRFKDQGKDQHQSMLDPTMAYLPYVQDPLVETLARMENYEHTGSTPLQPYAPEFHSKGNGVPPFNKMPNSTELMAEPLTDKRSRGLGASVLRNAFRRANPGLGPDGSVFQSADPSALSGGSNNLQSVSDFEAIKLAFQPTLASEEEGRRSWSAFDIWQSDIRGARHKMHWAEGGGNASADSLPQFSHAANLNDGSSGFLPLDRATSADNKSGGRDDALASSDAEQLRNLSKVKRAFRWPFRPTQVQEDLA